LIITVEERDPLEIGMETLSMETANAVGSKTKNINPDPWNASCQRAEKTQKRVVTDGWMIY